MSNHSLIKKISELKSGEINGVIKRRIFEFQKIGKGTSSNIFKELCFCLLTANYSAEGGIRIQNALGDGFLVFSEKRLAKELKRLGYRFPNIRAKFIKEARTHKDSIKDTIGALSSEKEAREWLVRNIKGLGWKEASHFLRNIGYKNLAIIDFHIVDLLERYKLATRPKTLTKKRYEEMEEVLLDISQKTNTTLAELDLYLWYLETGKVLK